MPLKFERVAKTTAGFNSEVTTLAVWYQDEFGQPRYFDFCNLEPDRLSLDMATAFGKELIQQVNELLARPRPSEGTVKRGGVTFNCSAKPLSPADEAILRSIKVQMPGLLPNADESKVKADV